MRIAQITRMLPRPDYAGGVSGQVDLLARELAARGHDVTVFATNPPADAAGYTFKLVETAAKTSRLGRRATPYLFSVAAARLPLNDFDVVHSHGDDHFVRTQAPVIRTFHGSSWGEARHGIRFRHRLYHFTMGVTELASEWRATVRVANSSSTQQYLRRPSVMIPCAYDSNQFFPAGSRSKVPSILIVGDLDTRKRGRFLVQLFERHIRPLVPEAELWVVSHDRVDAAGVRCLGRVSPAELADLYRRAWAFCLPSTYEGFGVPYVEAMACGTPVVATRNGGADDVLGGGKYGVLAGDDELAGVLVDLLQSSDRRSLLSGLALQRAPEYAITKVVEQYESLYTAVKDAA